MRVAKVVILVSAVLFSMTIFAKGDGNPHGGFGPASGESMPPGLQGKGMPPGLSKKGKTPHGWTKGKKKGWNKKNPTPTFPPPVTSGP